MTHGFSTWHPRHVVCNSSATMPKNRNGRDEAGKAAARDLTRAFKRPTDRALERLSRKALTDVGIHDVRKLLKRARAALRLLRKALGSSTYREVNGRLRDAARPFAAARDAKVLVETFESLAPRLRKGDRASIVRTVRRALEDERRRARRSFDAKVRMVSEEMVKRARDRAVRAVKGDVGWKVPGGGVRRVYRNGRKALRRARELRTVESLHEWRKQAKYLRHGLELLLGDRAGRRGRAAGARSAGGGRLPMPSRARKEAPLAVRAHRLSDLLGEDHDHAMLGVKLVTAPMDAAEIGRAHV